MKHYIEGTQHLIENYELAKADNFKGWECVSRLKYNDTFTKLRYTSSELLRMGKCWNRPPEELIWMTGTRRRQLDNLLWEKPAERIPLYEQYCPGRYKEIENFDKAKAEDFKGWFCYHKLSDTMDPEYVKANLYYNRPPEELVYLRSGRQIIIAKCKRKLEYYGIKWNHKDNPVICADRIGYPMPSDGIPAWDEDVSKYSDPKLAAKLKRLGLKVCIARTQSNINYKVTNGITYRLGACRNWLTRYQVELETLNAEYPED